MFESRKGKGCMCWDAEKGRCLGQKGQPGLVGGPGVHIWEHFGVFGPEMSLLPLVSSRVMQWDTPILGVPARALLASQRFSATPLVPQPPLCFHTHPWFRLALLLTGLLPGTHTAQEQGNTEQCFQEKKHLEI